MIDEDVIEAQNNITLSQLEKMIENRIMIIGLPQFKDHLITGLLATVRGGTGCRVSAFWNNH
jgi:hypothetical protein